MTSQKIKIYSSDPELYQATSCIRQPSVSVKLTQHMKKGIIQGNHKERKFFIIGDSHLTRIKKDSLRKKIKGDFYFKCFSGANTKQLDPYVTPVLVEEKPQTVIIHIGSNDITKFNYHDVDVNDLANRILQVGLKCRYYGVESIATSSVLVTNDHNIDKLIRGVNISLKNLCKVYGFDFI